MAKFYYAPVCISYPAHLNGQEQIDPGRANATLNGIVDLYSSEPVSNGQTINEQLLEHNILFPVKKVVDPNNIVQWRANGVGDFFRLPTSDYMIVMTSDSFPNLWADALGWELANQAEITDPGFPDIGEKMNNFMASYNASPYKGVE